MGQAWRLLTAALGRFGRSTDGGFTIFSLYMFVLMLIVGGLGVDFMRVERDRVRLQAALDRAVLAAAAIDQKRDPETVLRDYMAKAGMEQHLTEVKVASALGARQVSATAKLMERTFFLGLVGLDTLPVVATTTAEEAVDYLEVALVLDVSGSMRGSRINDLQNAARKFVELVMPENQVDPADGLTAISIVPYATTVNVGRDLLSRFTVNRFHGYSNCVFFKPEVFAKLALPPSDAIDQLEHVALSGSDLEPHPSGGGLYRIATPTCPRAAPTGGTEKNAILPWATARAPLLAAINGLTADGRTGIDIGFRWGTALVDPSVRSAVTDTVAKDGRATLLKGFPLSYDPKNVSKVVVLMTDGEMVSDKNLRKELRGGASNIFYDPKTNRHSLLLRGKKVVRLKKGNQDDTQPDLWYHIEAGKGPVDYPDTALGDKWRWTNTDNGTGPHNGLNRLDHPDVFDRLHLASVKAMVFEPNKSFFSSDEWTIYGSPDVSYNDNTKAKARLLQLCSLARNQGIAVYTIAMNAPSKDAQTLMSDCASKPGYYFDVKDREIEEAFSVIGRRIAELRLTR
ncbi:hypothetical protein OCGS_0509 [Oceaniovalibus guishaninsula JLT2003]|uniref:Putative Flp pilus-assembly TadG-like N-terminal domain-containing protein n=1 Tax=Oceaniovalibus guishaninsula JLT2003 TaxID=1231392 RepID=K2HRN9_9RHOB|nr:pilus assembly protein TadG-related protein [Oceaniovalibus guishaninsula]EKE45419.1 hypothetical protein OCGS_0509 [Oceaniovalibus guishaninsula JLT2003]